MGKFLTRTAFSVGIGFVLGMLAAGSGAAVGDGSVNGDERVKNQQRALILESMAMGSCTREMEVYNQAVQDREDAEAAEQIAYDAWYDCEYSNGGGSRPTSTEPIIDAKYSVLVTGDK